MKIFKDKQSLQKELFKEKGVSFIPTMGCLHSGHISLIRSSIKYKRKILVSIFVNPKQFNKKNDYISYPRNISNDIKKLNKANVDYLYIPSFKDIYEFKIKKKIFLDRFSKKLCGKNRKGHFKGVIDVINRFLEIIKPRFIFLGLKDFQQLYLIKKYIIKRFKSQIINCKIVRDKNKLALSSRNSLLNKAELFKAGKIAKDLIFFKKKLIKNKDLKRFLSNKKNELIDLYNIRIDYLELRNIYNLKNSIELKNSKLFFAYYMNDVRLIDNF